MQDGIAGPRGAAAAYDLTAGASSGNPVQKICLKRMRRGDHRIELILLVGGKRSLAQFRDQNVDGTEGITTWQRNGALTFPLIRF